MKTKMQLLKKFVPFMTYNQVDPLLEIFTRIAKEAGNERISVVTNNTNAFMVILQILDISDKIKGRFPLASKRAEYYEEKFIEILNQLLQEMYEP
jgi:hypothetical protein